MIDIIIKLTNQFLCESANHKESPLCSMQVYGAWKIEKAQTTKIVILS